MKILHLNTNDIKGGAARAAYRIHKGLLINGIDSFMLVQNKASNEPEVIKSYTSKFGNKLKVLRKHTNSLVQNLQKTSNPILHSSNILPTGLHKKINSSEADIVHLHWINGEMISISELSKIEKPIVWTLHDMWAFNGAAHYDDWKNPGRYKNIFSKNNRPNEYTGLDIDRWTWKRKKKYWDRLDIKFVTPSHWLADNLAQSSLFKGKKATIIPNGLDTTVFKPIQKNKAREILNFESDKRIILFGAMSAESNPIKGYSYLSEAKKILLKENKIKDLFFVVFGNDYKKIEYENGITTQYMGRINDNITLSLIYSAADTMIVPSIMEAFGQTASEAMACGTPVVAFNTTGLKDIVDHKKNGYLAKLFESEDLANGIRWVLEDEAKNKILGKKAHSKATDKFAIETVANQYIDMYKKVLED